MARKDGILPVPLAPRPILVLLFVQLNTIIPPLTGVVKITVGVKVLLQTTMLAGWFINGGGFTVMVKVMGVPVQVTPPLV